MESRKSNFTGVLPSPGSLKTVLAPDVRTQESISHDRHTIQSILSNVQKDDRILVVVGPCSIHDYEGAMDYATRLSTLSVRLQRDLVVVMRVYIEKPRTTVGWKGLVHDPDLTQAMASQALDRGLYLSRVIMLSVASLGLPVATEMLSPLVMPFLEDAVSLGIIGARTTESQTHRELASDMPFSVGFKNGTDGCLRVAFDAMKAAARPHSLLTVDEHGSLLQHVSVGNKSTFVVLRGGTHGTNYSPEHVEKATSAMVDAALQPAIMVDCSHGNSNKDYRNQAIVAGCVGDQIAAGADIAGVMIESNIHGGRQDIPVGGKSHLKYGVSITDGCASWQETEEMLEKLASAVQKRRQLRVTVDDSGRRGWSLQVLYSCCCSRS